MDYAETQARRVISTVPDGVYRFSDFIEADMVGQGLLRVNLTLTISGGEMHMDFTGTAPQVRAALNLPSFSKTGHWMLITGVVNWLCTREPNIAYNAGLVRPMKIHIPKGTIINPEPGAAYGGRYSTSHKVCDVIIGALSQAVPDQLPATDSGQGSILLVSVPDMATGETRVSVIQPLVGGSGGRPVDDGVDGTMVILNFLKNVPTELLEHEMPNLLIRRYALREDSGGAGRYRGGTGSIVEFETNVPFGYTILNPDSDSPVDIGKIDILEMDAGDVLRLGTQGGGGYGDPLERPAATVWEDVLDEYVSIETARERYGVIGTLESGLDAATTETLRREMRDARRGAPLKEFDFGPVREAYHAKWPAALHDAISAITQDMPRVQRQTSYRALYAEISRRLDAGESIRPGDVPDVLAALQTNGRRGMRAASAR
jgi:N-methylhydantoinase B